MKQRITALDLQVITAELQSEILNYRLQNIQNVSTSARQFVLKFAVPDSKKVLVLDCGHRVHLTEFDRPVTQTPSNFVTKLRKHLKSRRLSSIKQVGNDRVLVLEFSDGLYYLVLEFFSAGNIVLLDDQRKILSLQRLVTEKGDNDRYAVNETYNMFDRSLFESDFEYTEKEYLTDTIKQWISQHKEKITQNAASGKKGKVFSLHKLLFVNASHLSSDLIQKNLKENGIDAGASCLGFEDSEKLDAIVSILNQTEKDYIALTAPRENNDAPGFTVSKKNANYDPTDKSTDSLEFVLDEFHPFKPYKENLENFKFHEITGYNKTLDSFFSTIESVKYALRIEQQKNQAKKRLDNARNERDKQIQSLVAQLELNSKKGEAIIYHAGLVTSCSEYVQKLVNQQMDWTNMESLIKLEQNKGNHVAQSIKLPLNLKDNKINILLPGSEVPEVPSDSDLDSESESESESSESESESESDSDSESIPKKKITKKTNTKKQSNQLAVWVDISLSPYANAALFFDSKKNADSKQVKVEKNTSMALKNAERKIQQDLSKNLKQENETLKQIRPKYWFEKFFWFVSNEGYLCLAGRDSSQVDMIYYRHFSDNDYFVSSDVEGSLKVFIKNPFKGVGIPPSTLYQAGIFAMATSAAWNQKASTSAWNLPGDEISKKDFDGSLIAPGEFNYKGAKKYMPPAQLVMGFGFYVLGDEESSEKYKQIRLAKEEEHGLKVSMDNKKKDLEDMVGKVNFEVKEDSKEEPQETKDDVKVEATEAVADLEEEPESTESSVSPEPESQPESQKDDEFVDPIEAEMKKLKLQEAKEKSSQKGPKVRGKKAKMKKMAKYADQDEDDKRLRMEALGTLKQVEALEKQKQQEKENELEKEKNKYQESEAAQRRKKQDEREYQKYIMDEQRDDEASVTNYLEILDSFLSKPQPGDTFSNVIPVFAPWYSMNKLKYKVKIQPGNGKKGKGINEAINYFTNRKLDASSSDVDLDWPQEREFIKAAKPNDLVGVMSVNKVKLVLPGGSEATKGAKKAKRK